MFTIISNSDAKKLEWIKEYEQSIKNRVKVENILWDSFHGLRDLPTKEECKDMAILLGVPDSWKQSK